MTTEHEETEKFRPCPFCGVVPNPQTEPRIDVLIVNHHCKPNPAVRLLNPIRAYWDGWQSAHCWKLLDEKDEKIRRLREALEEIRDYNPETNHGEFALELIEIATKAIQETNPENRESDKGDRCAHGVWKADHCFTCTKTEQKGGI